MNLQRVARAVLSVTAIAWGIPLALAEVPYESTNPVHSNFTQLDANRDGFVSTAETKGIEGSAKFLAEADDNRDGRLDSSEFMKFQSMQDRAYIARVARDTATTAKVKAALLGEPNLESLKVSVETYKGEVLLSGFVKDDAQRRKAVEAATAVSGVTHVKDGMAVR